MTILNQLGGLVLGSVPTMVLFILVVVAYGLLVRRPMEKILVERRKRTTGAVEQAKGAISAAEAETKVYEDKLRSAKAQIFQERDRKIKQLTADKDAALAAARSATSDRVGKAKAEIEDSVVVARKQIEGMSEDLGAQILRAVLPGGAAGAGAAQ